MHFGKLIALVFFFLWLLSSDSFAQHSVRKEGRENYRSPFRYLVVADVTETQKFVNNKEGNWYLEVLMEDKAFNEKNLIQLFTLLGQRFADRAGLHVNVFTSLDALRTPEEYDRVDLWGRSENYRRFKYAVFARDGNGERFEFGIPGVIDSKEVIIKPAPLEWPPKGKVVH